MSAAVGLGAMNHGRGPWTSFKVVDANGDEFLNTLSYADHESSYRKHAQWWIRNRTRPQAYMDTDSLGRSLRSPTKPCSIIVELLD